MESGAFGEVVCQELSRIADEAECGILNSGWDAMGGHLVAQQLTVVSAILFISRFSAVLHLHLHRHRPNTVSFRFSS